MIFKIGLRIFIFSLSFLLAKDGILLMREQTLIGSVLVGVSIGLCYFLGWEIMQLNKKQEDVDLLKHQRISFFFILFSFLLAGLLTINITNPNRVPELDRSAVWEWLLSILCFSLGVLQNTKWCLTWSETVEWVRARKLEVIVLTVIFLAGLFLRLVYVLQHPYPWAGDEAEVGLEGMRLLNGEKTNIFDIGWSAQPNVSFLPTMFGIMIFGQSFFAVKLTSVLTGAFSVLAIYLLAREWFGFEVAVISSAFLVAYPVHLQFSRIGVGNIFDSLMAPLVLWLVFRAARTGRVVFFLLAGVFSGFTFYLYAGTRLVLALAIGAFIYIGITQEGFIRSNALRLGVYLGGLLVTINPIAVFFIQHPVYFMTRLGQESIFLNGWLERHMAETGLTMWQVLLDQFLRTVKVFFISNASPNFLNFDRPYLTILGATFFLLGYIHSLWKLFDRRHFALQMWFWSVVILGGVLTFYPPANTRLVMISPTMGVFIALGAWQVSIFLLDRKLNRSWVYLLNALLVLVLTLQNVSFYFIHYYSHRLFNHPGGEIAMEAGLELQSLGEKYDYFLLGDPAVILAEMPTTVFLAPNNKKVNLTAGTLSEFSIEPGHGAFVVALPENKGILDLIIEQHPGGELKFTNYKLTSKILYYSYVLPPDTGVAP